MEKLLLFIFFFSISQTIRSQNCTVNAGVDRTYCVNDSIRLTGFKAGSLSSGSTWTQVSGPSVVITSPGSLNTGIGGAVAGTMVFSIRNKCTDGSNAIDQVTITVLAVTKANAGIDQTFCPQTGNMSANSPGSNETGEWTEVSNNGFINLSNINSATSQYTCSQSNGGVTVMRWNISNQNGCSSSDEVTLTNYGGVSPVSVPDSIELDQCYDVFHSALLSGSYGGIGLGGQRGSWSQIRGPNQSTIIPNGDHTATANTLIQGVYYFEYSVSGPCANGKDTVKVTVPAPLGLLSPNSSQNIYLCDRPTTYMLSGSPPIYLNDTCSWHQISGPTTVTFSPPNAPNTTVSNLSGKGGDLYQFNYIMANPISNCRSGSIITLRYIDTPWIEAFPDRILACDQDTAFIRWRDTGGFSYSFSQVLGPLTADFDNIYSFDSLSGYIGISGLDSSGVYIFQVARNSGFGQSCANVEDEIKLIVSIQPDAANAGSSQRLDCGVDTTQLAGNIPTPGVGNWYQNSGPNQSTIDDSSYNLTSVRDLIAGKYEYRWLINGGQACTPTQDDVEVLIADTIPPVAAGGTDQTICFNAVLNLQGNEPEDGSLGVWRVVPDSGIVFTDSNSYITSATGMDSTKTYLFIWKVYNSCGYGEDTVSVTITSNIAAIPADAGDDRCLPDTTTMFRLDGNNPWPGFGRWTKLSGPSDTILSDTSFNSMVIPSGPGTYVYEWAIGNGLCGAGVDTVVITLSDTVTQAFAGLDIDTCSNNLILIGNEPIYGVGRWSLRIGRINGNMVYPDSFQTPVLNLAQGTYVYRWTIDNGACGLSYDEVKVNIANPTTVPVAQSGQIWCNPSSLSLQANNITSGLGYWSLSGSNPSQATISPKNSASASVTNLSAGIYTFKWNSVNPMGICPDLFSTRQDTVVFPANAGNDLALCKQYTVQLNGTMNSVGFWRQLSGDSAVIDTLGNNSAMISNLSSAGSPYQFIYEINPSYGCPDNSDTVMIEIEDSTRTPFAGYDQNLCDADTFHLDANDVSPDNGVWSQASGPNTGSFSDVEDSTSTFFNVTGGSYLLKWTSSNKACVKSDFVLIRNYDSSLTAYAGADTSICPPYAYLDADTAVNHQAYWTQISGPGPASIQTLVNPKTRIDQLAKGTYLFEWRVDNGYCPDSRDTVEISVPYDQPSTSNGGNDTSLCQQDSVMLGGNSPTIGSGTWTQISGSTVNIVDDTLYNSMINGLDTGWFSFEWKIQNGNCLSFDTVSLENTQVPSLALAGIDAGYCLYTPFNLSANTPSIGSGLWREIGGTNANIITPEDPATQVTGLGAGTYTFEWSIANGVCESSKDTVYISIDSIPSLSDAGPDIYTCLDTANMNATAPTSGLGQWNQLSGIDSVTFLSINSETSTVYGLDSGEYQFEWVVSKGGCESRDTMKIIEPDPQPNDKCLQPTVITDPGGTYYGDMCGAKKFGAEPSTYGYDACNTLFYRFRTTGYNYRKQITVDLLGMNNCPAGLRISLFDSAACPGLGVQHDTTIIANSTGYYVFDSLKSNWAYILVIDEFQSPCPKSICTLTFNVGGNALPFELLTYEVRSKSKTKAQISWESSDDRSIVKYEVWRTYNNERTLVGEIDSRMRIGNSSYLMEDYQVPGYPVTYELFGRTTSGQLKSFGTRVLVRSNEESLLIVYPNPGHDNFNLQLDESEIRPAKLVIVDSKGQTVYMETGVRLNTAKMIDSSNWSEGVYHIQVQVGDRIFMAQIIIIKS